MKILAVDTTGERLSLALGGGKRTLALASRSKRPHDESLFIELGRLLKKAGLEPSDIDAIAAASGPGRFTGIRIGMTFATVMARALGRPAVALSLLEAAALRSAAGEEGRYLLCAALPGIRGELFLQFFRVRRGWIVPAWEPVWAAPQDAARRLKEAAHGAEIRLCGAGAAQALALVKGSGRFGIVPGSERPLAAADILPLALRRLSRRKPFPVVPLYLKPANYERVHTTRLRR
ncbi:MAG: tRNA (adenosine(37)-N6)-threonylcarbamoyltransferase complex dimerization subunit type 1 TsaB [Elusimicrobia bacterium]|nr:tRNA (adenosine(37)-N6)-threonylcarbamoyltransferase complex dimerization subunit type 1 TsaB [Elusimicrobiota bacterium]